MSYSYNNFFCVELQDRLHGPIYWVGFKAYFGWVEQHRCKLVGKPQYAYTYVRYQRRTLPLSSELETEYLRMKASRPLVMK